MNGANDLQAVFKLDQILIPIATLTMRNHFSSKKIPHVKPGK